MVAAMRRALRAEVQMCGSGRPWACVSPSAWAWLQWSWVPYTGSMPCDTSTTPTVAGAASASARSKGRPPVMKNASEASTAMRRDIDGSKFSASPPRSITPVTSKRPRASGSSSARSGSMLTVSCRRSLPEAPRPAQAASSMASTPIMQYAVFFITATKLLIIFVTCRVRCRLNELSLQRISTMAK